MTTKTQKVVSNFDEHQNHDKLLDLCTVFSPGHRLREPSAPITKITDEIRIIIDSMEYLVERYAGFGIAAPQVGENYCMFMITSPRILFINPYIIKRRGSAEFAYESCLSIPKFSVKVPRTKYVEIAWYDINGNLHTKEFKNQTARVVQHEYDHLEGLLIDRFEKNSKQDEAILNEYDRRTSAQND